MRSSRVLLLAGLALPIIAAAGTANAIPTLQVYVEGATYDEATETWIGAPGGDGLLHVWAIGSASSAGGPGTLTSLKMTSLRMAILFGGSVDEGNDGEGLPIVLTAADTTFAGFTDSWNGGDIGDIMARTADIVTDGGSQLDTVLIGATVNDFLPIIGTGSGPSNLAGHDEFAEGRLWQEYNLPDMDFLGGNLVDVTDFNGDLDPPAPDASMQGILYAFTIDTGAFQSLNWHFDLYGVIEEKRTRTVRQCTGTGQNRVCNDVQVTDTTLKNEFAPFSHDGGGVGRKIAEPMTLALFGAGLIGLGIRRRVAA